MIACPALLAGHFHEAMTYLERSVYVSYTLGMKRFFTLLAIYVAIVSLVFAQPVGEKAEDVTVRVAALKGPTAMGLVELMEKGGESYSFTLESSPDAIVPLIAKGEVDIAAIPANLSSVMYNNTKGVKFLCVNTLGVLYLVGNGAEEITGRSALLGKTIYSAGKGSTPQYALESILSSLSLEDGKDVFVEWKSEHAECVASLLSDTDAIAMLPQPFATTALMKNPSFSIVLDLNELWEGINGSPLITGCLVVRSEFASQHPEAVEEFLASYEESVMWVNANTEEAARLIDKYGIIAENVAKKALPYCNITFLRGEEMKKAMNVYLASLFALNPKSIGGSIPGEEFYY